jgi:hypothetical protein
MKAKQYVMKKIFQTGLCMIVLMFMAQYLLAQAEKSAYNLAMEAYHSKDYAAAATQFNTHLQQGKEKLSNSQLYNGVCILALNGNSSESLELLQYLADKRYLSNLEHVSTDTDLQSLHALKGWPLLLERMDQNKRTLPVRTTARAKKELLKAKALLAEDNGKLWGENFWTENTIVLGADNTVYALYQMPGSTSADGVIYTKTIAGNVLSQTNTSQLFEGKQHAVITAGSLNDSSATIIHELFHVHQFKKAKFLGDPVTYLDNRDARELLRLEYDALRQALQAILSNRGMRSVNAHIQDALLFRKIRQQQYASSLDKELQIETLEGLANYTGFVLSAWSNKYEKAIQEIDSREQAETYTRPFVYATGAAYGLLFDYLKLPWKKGPWEVYNFLSIYETNRGPVSIDEKSIQGARRRNNYETIHARELNREEKNNKLIVFYTDLLVTKPVLRATLGNTNYAMSFNMNGTLALEGKGIVYSSITGTDVSGKNFGNFKTLSGKDMLGAGGILCSEDRSLITFPAPLSVEGRIIKGVCYEIELAEGWEARKINNKGDLEIVKSTP